MFTFTTRPLFRLNWLPTAWTTLPQARSAPQTTPAVTIDQLQLVLHKVYQRFFQSQPTWLQLGFDERFLQRMVTPRFVQYYCIAAGSGALPTGLELAFAWNRQFGPLIPNASNRMYQQNRLQAVANDLLHSIQIEIYAQQTTL